MRYIYIISMIVTLASCTLHNNPESETNRVIDIQDAEITEVSPKHIDWM
ncbi:MAG: hypothetical protein WAW59_07100 [Patescibacteria group bacterium]